MQTRWKGRLPREVHYQCMWLVKDIERLYRLDAMRRHGRRDDEIVLFEEENCRSIRDEVMEQAGWKLACVKEALEVVPEEYRIYIIENIVNGDACYEIAHENTWRRWRRIFLKELAYKLKLI